ncbi:MAG: peroxiredoxin [Sphingomonadaceae bacterium]|nr:peroxiredoxin [Sphingomonadaceae bacterium]
MTIAVGERVPEATLMKATDDGPRPVTTKELFDGRTVVLFCVPGAFTPTCSARHLPGYVENAARFAGAGVAEIVCVAVNDAFVMGAWGRAQGADGKVTMVSDGNGDFVKRLGLEFDGSKYGMGIRGQRFAMVVRDGTVQHLFVEEPGAFKVSSAEHVLEALAA